MLRAHLNTAVLVMAVCAFAGAAAAEGRLSPDHPLSLGAVQTVDRPAETHREVPTAQSQHCAGDLNGDGAVGVQDLLVLINNWGPCSDPNDCPGDLTGSGEVGVPDLLALVGMWGQCPVAPCADAVYIYDNCQVSVAIGLTAVGTMGWAQRFDAGDDDTIHNIAAMYGMAESAVGAGVEPGDPVEYAVMADSGNGPGAVIWQGEDVIDADAIQSTDPQILAVDNVAVSGTFYVAVWVFNDWGYPAPMDQSNTDHLDGVWMFGETVPFDEFDPSSPATSVKIADAGMKGVWLLRANQAE